MRKAEQLNFLQEDRAITKDDWTFNGASTRELTHCYHDYPARMIPQVAAKLIDSYSKNAQLLFDPYCGTGTSLVEGLIRGLNVIGTDLNPLARLIAEAKTSLPDFFVLDNGIKQFHDFLMRSKPIRLEKPPAILGISKLDFWFKPDVIEKLLRLKVFIDTVENDEVRLFFKIAFSETVRESSNTRNEEFKLYRYDPERLKHFNPDVFYIMSSKLKRNRLGLERFADRISALKDIPFSRAFSFNSVEGIPEEFVKKNSVDIVVTSPPYGDSHTTVAYGQYSRLSAAWLDLEEAESIDRKLMGGRLLKKMPYLSSEELRSTISLIAEKDSKRALEVATFYQELYQSIINVAQTIKQGGYACYVVGNRKVKGIVLPTDVVIRDFFSMVGYDHVETHQRLIPNKRMPLRNSPTNAAGVLGETMTREFIVVMRRRRSGVVSENRAIYYPSSRRKVVLAERKRDATKNLKKRKRIKKRKR